MAVQRLILSIVTLGKLKPAILKGLQARYYPWHRYPRLLECNKTQQLGNPSSSRGNPPVTTSCDYDCVSSLQPSATSGFYVLNDWQDTFSDDGSATALPASSISNIMLKTLGILRVPYTPYPSLLSNVIHIVE